MDEPWPCCWLGEGVWFTPVQTGVQDWSPPLNAGGGDMN
jgi:hypothetical protein